MGAGTSSDQPSAVAVTPARGNNTQREADRSPAVTGAAAKASSSGVSPAPTSARAGGRGQWQHGSEDGTWQDFPESANERIEAAFAEGAQGCEVSLGRHLFKLQFLACRMQSSAGGGAPRNIRRVVQDAADEGTSPAEKLFADNDETPNGADGTAATTNADATVRHYTDGGRHITINDRLAKGHPEKVTLASTAKAHNSLVYCAAFTTDGKTICTGGRDGTLRMWELDTGYVVRNFNPVDAVVLNCAIAPGKSLVASGADDHQLRLYNVSNAEGRGKCMPGHTHKVYGVDFTCDSKWIFTSSMDTTNKVWDVARGKCIHTFQAHTASAFTVKCSPFTPHMCVSGGDDNLAFVFDLRQETPVATLRGHTATLWAADINFDESLIATSGMDSKILLWDTRKTDAPVTTIGSHGKSPVHCVEFCGDGRRLLSCGRDSTWRVWDVDAALASANAANGGAASHADDPTALRDHEVCRVHAHDGVVFGVSYSHARSQVLSIGADAYVRLWNARV